MGKQICFFVNQKDVNVLIEYIYSLGAIIMDGAGTQLTKRETSFIADYKYCQESFGGNKFFVAKPEWLGSHLSEAIEFSLCLPVPRKIIDTSSVDNLFRRGEFIVINDSEKYHRLMKELLINPPYIENPCYIENGFEHGRFWFDNSYLSQKKEKPQMEFYNFVFDRLKKSVQRDFRLSEDKKWYIGPQTYEEYLCGKFVPCSGRNKILF